MLNYVWPKGRPGIRVRVVVALSLLVGAKVIYVFGCIYHKPFQGCHILEKILEILEFHVDP